MEHWFQDRLQVSPGDFLGDSIGDSGQGPVELH